MPFYFDFCLFVWVLRLCFRLVVWFVSTYSFFLFVLLLFLVSLVFCFIYIYFVCVVLFVVMLFMFLCLFFCLFFVRLSIFSIFFGLFVCFFVCCFFLMYCCYSWIPLLLLFVCSKDWTSLGDFIHELINLLLLCLIYDG